MERLERWFGAEEHWERVPSPQERRRDVRWALIGLVMAVVAVELMRSGGALEEESLGIGWQYVAIVSGCLLVAFRRRAPIVVMLLAAAHFVVAGQLMPMTMSSLPMQLLLFFLIFSGIAWARDRRAVLLATLAVLLLMALWMAWWFALGSGMVQVQESMGDVVPGQGLVSPVTGLLLYLVLTNLIYFGFAIGLGVVAWRGALARHRAEERATTITEQGWQLRDQAVVAERLRIARELHDVVAHHVSIMGVQAAAARRVMDRDPEAARAALGAVESSSRSAVGQMRDLLGTLRSGEQVASVAGPEVPVPDQPPEGMPSARRFPQPTLADLPALAQEASTPLCRVQVDVVESEPGAAAQVPAPVQLSAYRVVQEALANVRRHSTAREARAVVRVDSEAPQGGQVEVEVVDDGHARAGTSGSGLGLLGMRERAHHLGGGVESGPRVGRTGWRVRVWFPLDGRGGAPARDEQGEQGAPGQDLPAVRSGVR